MIRSLAAFLRDLARAAVLVAADHIAPDRPIAYTPTDDTDYVRQMFAEQLEDDALVAEYLDLWEEA